MKFLMDSLSLPYICIALSDKMLRSNRSFGAYWEVQRTELKYCFER